MSEAQKRAYIIADNKLAEKGGWDDEMPRVEIASLQDEDFDVSRLGFEDVELAQLPAAQELFPNLTEEDASFPVLCHLSRGNTSFTIKL